MEKESFRTSLRETGELADNEIKLVLKHYDVLERHDAITKSVLEAFSAEKLETLGVTAGAALLLKRAFPCAAAGPGSGSTAAGGLPPPKLSDVAHILRPESASSPLPPGVQLYRLTRAADKQQDRAIFPLYYVDSSNVVGKLTSWLDTVSLSFVACPIYNTVDVGTAPLFIHGFIKSGKSLVLGGLLPAVLRQHPFFGVGGPAEMLYCPLDFAIITSQGMASYKERLKRLLLRLQGWAGSAAPASDNGQPDDVVYLQESISRFFWTIGRPVLYTVDELQAWFLFPGNDTKELGMARAFIKEMLCHMPRNAATAVTGSSMCIVWSNIAAMVPNGVTLSLHNLTLTLPAESHNGAKVAWDFLRSCRPLPDELHDLSAPLPSMLTFLCNEFVSSGGPSDVFAFVRKHENLKMMLEMSRDFGTVLQQLSPDSRKLLFDLASEGGAPVRSVDDGLWLMLEPLLMTPRTSDRGTYKLTSSYHSRLVKMLVTKDGDMQPMLTYKNDLPPIVLLEAREKLLRFGNTVVKAWQQGIKQGDPLQHFFQGLADSGRLTDEVFEAAVQSPYNCIGAANRRTCGEDWSAMPPWKKVALYHRLLRNTLAHEDDHESWQTYDAKEDMLMEDSVAHEAMELIKAYPFGEPNFIPELLRGCGMSSRGGLPNVALGAGAKGTDYPPGGLSSGGGGMVAQALPLGLSRSNVLPRTSIPFGRQVNALHHHGMPAPRVALQRAASCLPRIKLV